MIRRFENHSDAGHGVDDLPESRMQRVIIEIALIRNRDSLVAQNIDRTFPFLLALVKPVKPFQLRDQILITRHCSPPPYTPRLPRDGKGVKFSTECGGVPPPEDASQPRV